MRRRRDINTRMGISLTDLGLRLDSWGGHRKMARFRQGWPARTDPRVKFHRTPLTQYRYLEAGSGRTIVFTVDPPMTLQVYSALVEEFARSFRVVAVELPGMGFSAVVPGFGFGFRETNDDLAAFLREVCGPQSVFAFSCVASLAALDIARRMPELASHLCLIQAGGVAAFARWKAGRDPDGLLGRPVIGQLVMKRIAPRRMPSWYDLSVGRRDMVGRFCACAEHSFREGAMWSLASAYQRYMSLDAELPAATQPLLSIWGGADRSHPAINRHSLGELYPDVERVSFEDLGHTPELEDPHRVCEAITRFIAQPRSTSTPPM